MTTPKLAFTVEEAAEATGLSKTHLRSEMNAGRLASRSTSFNAKDEPVGRRLILARDLEAYLENLGVA